MCDLSRWTFADYMGSTGPACPRLSLMSLCALKFHYKALFPKGNKTKTFIGSLYWTSNKCSPQSCKLPSCWFKSEEPHWWNRKWPGRNSSGNSQQWEPSIPVPIDWISHGGSPAEMWNERGRKGQRKEGRRVERSSEADSVEGSGGVEETGKKQVWSGKLVQLSGQNIREENKESPKKQIRGDLKRTSRKTKRETVPMEEFTLLRLSMGEMKETQNNLKCSPLSLTMSDLCRNSETVWVVRSVCAAPKSCWGLSVAGREAVWGFQVHWWMTNFPIYAEQHLTNGKAGTWVDYTWTSCNWMYLVQKLKHTLKQNSHPAAAFGLKPRHWCFGGFYVIIFALHER